MEDDQQFCLRWNNHQSTLIQNFDTLLESGTLVDCTLAAEGKYLKAHKVVLSACSPYFEGLLSEHYDKHPVFILKDVKFKELKAMMDYMYRGEVNISQDQLAALLKAAESLQIKGLSESKTGGTNSNTKTDTRQQKSVAQPPPVTSDIPHASSGLTIEKNSKVPRQSAAHVSVADIPEDSASPQLPKGVSSREGSQSPVARKRKRMRRRSVGDDNSMENHEASNSSDIPQQMGVASLGVTPISDDKAHSDPGDSVGKSALMTHLTKPADDMHQIPLEKAEPTDNLIEPKSEYLEDPEESVEDLTLDDDMNDLNEMEQDNNRAGPSSHDPSQHPGLAAWHVTGDRSNAGGVVGAVAGAPGANDEVFLAAQEAAQAHRDSQGQSNYTSDEIADAEETKSEYVDEESLDMAEEFFEEVSEDKCCEEVDREEKMTKNDSVIAINDIVYQCEFCDKIYRWPTSLNRHRKHCTKRQVSSKNKGQSIEVEEIHVNETEEEEVKDSKAHDFISASRFREVQKYTPIAGTYKCWDCGRVYQWASSLSRHRTIECGPRNKMKFVCTMCSYKTGYRGNFLRHLKAPRHIMNRHYGKRISEGTLKRVKEVTIEATEDDN